MHNQRGFRFRDGSGRAAAWLAVVLPVVTLQAWGPHETITQASLDVLGTQDPLVLCLGSQAQRLTNYAWMGDYFGVVVEEPEELFYADDYLLFPSAPKYFDHTGPEVMQAIRPFFQRALQALRTENAANAARWVGSLVHFVQDAGCPPHAAGLRGEVHSRMENWVDPSRIRIPDYRARALGTTDNEALQSLLRRLEDLVPLARERARRLRPQVEMGNRSAVGDPMLDSALECACLTTDLLYTLGQLRQRGSSHSAALHGLVASQPPVGMERFPTRVILQGTSFATLADLSGHFEFHHLPAGNYTVLAYRPGNTMTQATVQVKDGETNSCQLALPREPGTLVPNGDFKLSWVNRTSPDYWYPNKGGWEGEPILLKDGQRYRLRANFREGAKDTVLVRWLKRFDHAVPRFKIEPRFQSRNLTARDSEMVFTAGPEMSLLHITVRSRVAPGRVCESISLTPLANGE